MVPHSEEEGSDLSGEGEGGGRPQSEGEDLEDFVCVERTDGLRRSAMGLHSGSPSIM